MEQIPRSTVASLFWKAVVSAGVVWGMLWQPRRSTCVPGSVSLSLHTILWRTSLDVWRAHCTWNIDWKSWWGFISVINKLVLVVWNLRHDVIIKLKDKQCCMVTFVYKAVALRRVRGSRNVLLQLWRAKKGPAGDIVPQDSILCVSPVMKWSFNGCFIALYQQRFKNNVSVLFLIFI